MSGGGRETPRQKMIGMMYLFYTAMLALQVSNSVLERFVFINLSLEKQVRSNDEKNSQVLNGIVQAVEKRGNRADDTLILNKAKEVRAETRKVIVYCDSLKSTMVKITGGYDENHQIVGVKDQDKVANLMINQNKGEELKKTLNDYATILAQKTGKNIFTPIALDGKDHPAYKMDKDQKVKNFADLFFESTPTAAGMASVSELETEVMDYENRALGELANQVGAKEVRFDKIIVMAKPESNMVAAGTKYKADLFLAASSSQANLQVSVDGRSIPVVDGFGKVEFTVSAGSYDNEGKAKKSYEAEILFQDSTYKKEIEYFAVKPVIQIQSASIAALYLNCGNELNVQVPALGNTYNPTFTAKGADVVPDKTRRGFVTLIPSATQEVVLTVSSGGYVVGSAPPFKIRGIPKPDIIMQIGGKPVDEKNGEKTAPRSISLVAVPEKNFADALPKDARYRVMEWEVMLARGRRQIGRTIQVSGPDGNVTELAAQAQPGDRFVATVKSVMRMNFKDAREEVNVGSVVKNLNITGQ
jgi:gliding motility-associated protein GldM